MDERHLVKQSVDAMHVPEMHVEQMKMKVRWDFVPHLAKPFHGGKHLF